MPVYLYGEVGKWPKPGTVNLRFLTWGAMWSIKLRWFESIPLHQPYALGGMGKVHLKRYIVAGSATTTGRKGMDMNQRVLAPLQQMQIEPVRDS